MRMLPSLANPLEIRGQIQIVHPIGVDNPKLNEEMEEEVGDLTLLSFPKWNYSEMIINLIMIFYWLICIFELACCKFKINIVYVWSPWKELMEKVYEDKNMKADYKMMEEYIDSYYQPNEPFFTKMIHEFHVYLGCGQIQCSRQCSTYEAIEITPLEIIKRTMCGRIWVEDSLSQRI